MIPHFEPIGEACPSIARRIQSSDDKDRHQGSGHGAVVGNLKIWSLPYTSSISENILRHKAFNVSSSSRQYLFFVNYKYKTYQTIVTFSSKSQTQRKKKKAKKNETSDRYGINETLFILYILDCAMVFIRNTKQQMRAT